MRVAWRRAVVPAASLLVAGFTPAALYQDLFSYPEDELRALFRDIVTGTGESCAEVTRTAFLGADEKNSGYFVFSCSGGRRYVLQINDDGTGKVAECEFAATLGMDCDRPKGPDRKP